jgi:hypothetical protein
VKLGGPLYGFVLFSYDRRSGVELQRSQNTGLHRFNCSFHSHSLPPTSDPSAMASGLNANPAGLFLKDFAF